MQIGIPLQWRITDLITPSQNNSRLPHKATLSRTVAKKGPTCLEIMGLPGVKNTAEKETREYQAYEAQILPEEPVK